MRRNSSTPSEAAGQRTVAYPKLTSGIMLLRRPSACISTTYIGGPCLRAPFCLLLFPVLQVQTLWVLFDIPYLILHLLLQSRLHYAQHTRYRHAFRKELLYHTHCIIDTRMPLHYVIIMTLSQYLRSYFIPSYVSNLTLCGSTSRLCVRRNDDLISVHKFQIIELIQSSTIYVHTSTNDVIYSKTLSYSPAHTS